MTKRGESMFQMMPTKPRQSHLLAAHPVLKAIIQIKIKAAHVVDTFLDITFHNGLKLSDFL
jgi:hypothetical protein